MNFYILFTEQGFLYKIADSNEEKNILSNNLASFYKIETTEDVFNGVKSQTLDVKYLNNSIVTSILNPKILNKSNFDNILNNYKSSVSACLNNYPSYIFYEKWNSYLNILNNIDTSNIVFPLNMSLTSYLLNEGHSVPSILQLP